MWIGPASPDVGVELLRQLFLQCSHPILWMRSSRVWMRSSRVWMRSSRLWMRSSRVWMRSSRVWMRSSRVWMRSSRGCMRSSRVWTRSSRVWTRSSRIVRMCDCNCYSGISPRFDLSILRHSGIWGTADEAVLNKVHEKKIKKSPSKNTMLCELV